MSELNNHPVVSIAIPSYNHADYIQKSIQSIIDQDYKNVELIIIDDGSKDNSVEIIKSMIPECQDRFLRFEFRHRPNKGLCATLNEALEWCQGEYFSPIASDDIALPHKTSFLISKILNTEYSAVFGSIQSFGNDDTIIKSPDNFEYKFSDLLMHKFIPSAPAALIKTQDIRDLGGYYENLPIEDWAMWLNLTYNGKKLISYNEVVCLYRIHDNNTVNDDDLMYTARKQIIDLYSGHPLYESAVKKNLYLKARYKASTKVIEPIYLLWQSKYFNKDGAFVLLKAITPNKLINLKRKTTKKIK